MENDEPYKANLLIKIHKIPIKPVSYYKSTILLWVHKNNYRVCTGTQLKNYFHDVPRSHATRVVFNFL